MQEIKEKYLKILLSAVLPTFDIQAIQWWVHTEMSPLVKLETHASVCFFALTLYALVLRINLTLCLV